LVCGVETPASAKVTYEIDFPEEGLPGWAQTQPSLMVPGGYVQFRTRVPFPPKVGAHVLKVKAGMCWDGGQTEITRDVTWFATADVSADWKPWQ